MLLVRARELAGSSPLTRGKPTHPQASKAELGLIPAHAGKTRVCLRRRRACRAHPRSRGENAIVGRPVALMRGSSPLTRGKLTDRVPHGLNDGLIPAHAGKTTDALPSVSRPWAHPRSRGENFLPSNPAPDPRGSSPLTRGKLLVFFLCVVSRGLIPAHAGKT